MDCNGVSCEGYESWLGDSSCDDGTAYTVDFDCETWSYDGGDCVYVPTCLDCNGDDCSGYEDEIGDGNCDDGSWFEFDFDCSDFSKDGGDCEEDGLCSTCLHNYEDYGGECCDAADDEYGISCAALEDMYGWDCSGCTCVTQLTECTDCVGRDCSEAMDDIGNQLCDDGFWGIDYNCEAFDYGPYGQ